MLHYCHVNKLITFRFTPIIQLSAWGKGSIGFYRTKVASCSIAVDQPIRIRCFHISFFKRGFFFSMKLEGGASCHTSHSKYIQRTSIEAFDRRLYQSRGRMCFLDVSLQISLRGSGRHPTWGEQRSQLFWASVSDTSMIIFI